MEDLKNFTELDNIVTYDELEQPIQVRHAYKWVMELINRYRIHNEAMKYFRLKNGITKRIIDELIPIGILMNKNIYNGDDWLHYYPRGDRSYEAKIKTSGGKTVKRIEVTQAIDGKKDIILRETLNRYGEAPLTADIQYSGNKKNRVIPEPKSGVQDGTEIQFNYENLIHRAFQKKLDAKYKGCVLIIGFEDNIIVGIPDEFSLIIPPKKKNPFKKVYIIGNAGHVFKEYF